MNHAKQTAANTNLAVYVCISDELFTSTCCCCGGEAPLQNSTVLD